MRRRFDRAQLVLMLAAGACAAALPLARQAGAQQRSPNADAMRLGVTTHFGQGWGGTAWTALASAGVPVIRDSIGWRQIETRPGVYEFTTANSGFVHRACDSGRRVLLTLEPRNPLYDSGQTAYSPAARLAFGAYARAVATQFQGCLVGIEIGNEINNNGGMTGPAATDRANAHVALVRAVRDAVKPVRPDLPILGGSTLGVATGFLKSLFAAGLGDVADGVVIHPYRKTTVNLDADLARLNAMMGSYGRPLPIWATEFSDNLSDQAGPSFAIRMIAQMSAGGVHDAVWYALLDEPALYPNMGLYRVNGQAKPVRDTVAMLARALADGDARPGPAFAPGVYDYIVGRYRFLWGVPRRYTAAAGAQVFDAAMNPLPAQGTIGDDPIVVEGGDVTLGPVVVVADTLYGYARGAWTYLAQRGANAPGPLALIDDDRWQSYVGSRRFPATVVNPLTLTTAGTAAMPVWTILRYTATDARSGYAQACIARQTDKGDGVQLRILVNGTAVRDTQFRAASGSAEVPVNLTPGDQLDFAVGPGQTALGDVVRYRFRLSLAPGVPAC